MKTNRTLWISGLLLMSLGLTAVAPAAQADMHRHWGDHDWNRGHWVHDRHDGRLGWWWVVGASWLWYARPHTFVEPVPTTVVVQQPAPVIVQPAPVMAPVGVTTAPAPVNPVLYYCKATGTHYPETMTCPGGWLVMTAETPPQP